MGNPTLIKNYVAEGAISACRIVKFGTFDGQVKQAAAKTDLLVGVNEALPVVDGERVDVVHAGITDIEFGGTVSHGAPVTADAQGRAIAAAAGDRVIGMAIHNAAAGDIAPVLLTPGAA